MERYDLILHDVSAIWGVLLGKILNLPNVCCFPGAAFRATDGGGDDDDDGGGDSVSANGGSKRRCACDGQDWRPNGVAT